MADINEAIHKMKFKVTNGKLKLHKYKLRDNVYKNFRKNLPKSASEVVKQTLDQDMSGIERNNQLKNVSRPKAHTFMADEKVKVSKQVLDDVNKGLI